MDWALVFILVTASSGNQQTSVSQQIVPGFETEADCEFAGNSIAFNTMGLYNKTKNQLAGKALPNGNVAENYTCILIKPNKKKINNSQKRAHGKPLSEACNYWLEQYKSKPNKSNAKMTAITCEGKIPHGKYSIDTGKESSPDIYYFK